ncbi:ribose 5-phosphate isomerase A [Bathymodiolus platifrons methanotrophic gill symbiont]|uniref:ribose-5-phosphate isomerase RpiA n=1 Tax=Bathymodiolus platifrons methanotrophic gill symbiont TaxID=113268 RepID=UPI000B4144CB|nr:ribose-5-phosphate isomerase RpiA [Bathymodiolus platifrons methanotrophic gill symbiont]MCK5870211.1 ribose-5-phosphate isomerase RpiA [Methyloprofundus sp.]TXK97801.1 ribose 5-phosphate isomerase A [Methylococcaceae bacterium CS4]TXL00403.1 ribose 5-phosphate isomerase A [Methylococcaceae bacterium CS5]TXL02778.1 ribose 5-phosphate isomerase A [Methylococcaceae bacterium CS3]TXL03505.1 ribose 5-phosphate isomerase A [Methylococcaceae bacterium CS2]TXL08047.1 ribose 5-phosphate isomerase 
MNDKELVAQHAARLVKNGMTVGLGTGSTADFFISELARRQQEEGLQVSCVSSSVVSMLKAQNLGLSLVAIEHLTHLDLYVDGAEEVSPDNALLKGRGADLVREKLLARASNQFIVLVDQSKMVEHIGANFAIPIEVMPFAWQLVQQSLKQLGGTGDLRPNTNGNGLAVTSYGSLVLDMSFKSKQDSAELDALLNATPGVVEHGIFQGLASTIFLADKGVVQEIQVN